MEVNSVKYVLFILYLCGMAFSLISGIENKLRDNEAFSNKFLFIYSPIVLIVSLLFAGDLWILGVILIIIPVYICTYAIADNSIFKQNLAFIFLNVLVSLVVWFFNIFALEVIIMNFLMLLIFLFYYNQIIWYYRKKKRNS